MAISANQEVLFKLMSRPIPGGDLPAPKSAIIGGRHFEVSYHISNRECYDGLPTPTLMLKVDGKRTSKKTAIGLLA